MQNQLLDSHSELFVREFFNDHEEAIILIGYDERKPDFIETPYSGGHPENVRYHTRKIECCAFHVTGFVFKHPHGATITAEFSEPFCALQRTLEKDGEEIDSISQDSRLEKMIGCRRGVGRN